MPVPLSTFRKRLQIWSDDAGWGSSFLSTGKTKEACKTRLKQSRAWLIALPVYSLLSAWPSLECIRFAFFWWDFNLPQAGLYLICVWYTMSSPVPCSRAQTMECFNVINTALGEKVDKRNWNLLFVAFVFWSFRHLLNLCFFSERNQGKWSVSDFSY